MDPSQAVAQVGYETFRPIASCPVTIRLQFLFDCIELHQPKSPRLHFWACIHHTGSTASDWVLPPFGPSTPMTEQVRKPSSAATAWSLAQAARRVGLACRLDALDALSPAACSGLHAVAIPVRERPSWTSKPRRSSSCYIFPAGYYLLNPTCCALHLRAFVLVALAVLVAIQSSGRAHRDNHLLDCKGRRLSKMGRAHGATSASTGPRSERRPLAAFSKLYDSPVPRLRAPDGQVRTSPSQGQRSPSLPVACQDDPLPWCVRYVVLPHHLVPLPRSSCAAWEGCGRPDAKGPRAGVTRGQPRTADYLCVLFPSCHQSVS